MGLAQDFCTVLCTLKVETMPKSEYILFKTNQIKKKGLRSAGYGGAF